MYNNFSSKKTKKVISALLASALVVTSAPISAEAATTKVLGVNKTFTKTATKVSGLSKSEKKIVKVTVNKSKKKVTVKGLKPGKASFKIGSKSYTVKVGAVKIKKKSFGTSMTAGTDKKVTVTSSYGAKDTLKWSSSDKKVVKVKLASTKATSKKVATNRLYALKAGTATITVKSKNTGKSLKVKVTVKAAETATATPATTPTTVPTATGGATTPNVEPTATATAPTTTATAPTTTATAPTTTATAPTATATGGAVETQTPGAQETISPTATNGAITVTTNVSGASVKVISGSATLLSVTAGETENSVTSGVLAPGTYTVEISKKGYDTVTKTVTVNGNVSINVTLAEAIQTGASVKVENELEGHENTVLVNDNAIVTVTMKDKDGKPVANKVVVLSLGTYTKTGTTDLSVEVKGQNVATTDANGNATFVVGSSRAGVKATDGIYVGSIKYTATVLGENAAATGSIGFAAINVGQVAVGDGTDDYDYSNLKAGTSAKDAGYNTAESVVYETTNAAEKDAEFILGQQVSSKEDDNSVSFNVVPKLVLPEMANSNDKADEFAQPIELASGKYHTYSDADETIKIKVDTSKLTYATLNFDKLQLSPYSEIKIEFYKKADTTKTENKLYDASNGSYAAYDVTVTADDVEGLEKNNFAVQIPLTKDPVKAVKVTLLSAGQVQTDMNDGYSIKNITGVYNAYEGNAGKEELLSSAKITWEAVTPTYSEPKDLKFADATDPDGLAITAKYSDDTFSYEVPVFPYTGNAVITEKDVNGKLIAYYLVPTENQVDKDTKKNTNDIARDAVSDKYVKAYKATEKEVKNFITTGVTQNENGSLVKVDTENSGITTLKGTLSIDGIGSDLLDATNKSIYTSVQWNPIEDKEESTANAFLAIAGQKVTVTGQLVDKNGNEVSLEGESINFFQNGEKIVSDSNVTVVKPASTTDANGQSTIVLSAAQAKEYIAVTATSSKTEKYDVKLSIGGINAAEQADLYWVDADLQFLKKVGETTDDETANRNTTSNNTIEVDVQNPIVGTPWEYGVKTVGGELESGKLNGYTIDIDGLKIFMASSESNKGTYKDVENGTVSAESAYVNDDVISAKLTGDSVTDNITFTAKHPTKDELTFTCVGEGTPNMNAKINMNVKWQPKGVSLSLLAPKGTSSKTEYNKLYVKLMDKTGKNPLANTEVTFTSGNENDQLIDATNVAEANIDAAVAAANNGLGATNTVTLTTNKYGVAQIYVSARGTSGSITSDNQSSIITAAVPSMEQTTSTTLNWLFNDKTPALGVVRAAKTDEKQVTVYFNNELNSGTVKPGSFKLTGKDSSGKDVVYDVTSVETKGKAAILTISDTLPAGEYTVEVLGNYTAEGINYTVSDIVAQTPTEGSKVKFYSTKNATFNLDLNADRDGFEIKNMSSPVDIMDASSAAKVDESTDKTKDFVITVNGEIVDQSTAFVKYTGADDDVSKAGFTIDLADLAANSNYDGKFVAGTIVKVYYMGTEESYTISASDVAAQVFAKVLSDNGALGNDSSLVGTNSSDYLTDNDYTLTAKVVADDGDDSLYTTKNAEDGITAGLEKILDVTTDTDNDGVVNVFDVDTALTNIKTAASLTASSGQFVKIALTITNASGKVVGTKTVTLEMGTGSCALK